LGLYWVLSRSFVTPQ